MSSKNNFETIRLKLSAYHWLVNPVQLSRKKNLPQDFLRNFEESSRQQRCAEVALRRS